MTTARKRTQANSKVVAGSSFDIQASDMAIEHFENLTNHADRSWRGGVGFDGLDVGTSIQELQSCPEFNWQVEKVPMHRPDGSGFGNFVGLQRVDDQTPFGTATNKVEIVQNDEAIGWFKHFFDSGLAMFESAGTFKNGQKCWMMARMAGKPLMALPDDPFMPYLLMTWGHDGKTALTIQPLSFRISCANQMPALLENGNEYGVKLKHRSGIKEAMEEVKDVTSQAYAGLKDLEANLARLAKLPVNMKSLENYFRRALKLRWRDPNAIILDQQKFEEQMSAVSYNLEKLFNTHEVERHTMPVAAQDTLYHCVNTITRFATHEQKAKDDETRFHNNFWGPGHQLRKRGYQVALQMEKEMA
jgi:phage/plasmid-like protein (TIGR03299 family)